MHQVQATTDRAGTTGQGAGSLSFGRIELMVPSYDTVRPGIQQALQAQALERATAC
ncbi:hypothetical protein [Cupriavidus necator]|uniref:hypothetical protein n=1 Tax=Cupriavidus necator TaxID=106590 RepID=UPI0009C2A39F|nr:hypothetical protein [Cupriavidus necator]